MPHKKIEKLGHLINSESFLQLDLVKGFKYIDKAGEIVNLYTDLKRPTFQMALSQLLISQPTEKIDQLKVSSENIWAQFTSPDSVDLAYQTFEVEANKLLSVLDVDTVSRIGWRNHFVIEFDKPEEATEYLGKMAKITVKDCKLSMVKLDLVTSAGVLGNLHLQEVVKEDAEKTHAVMFDIDLYKAGPIGIQMIGKTLKGFRDYLADHEGFLALVNEHLA